MELVWLRSFFLDGLKSWVGGAFMNANHFPLLYLNQGQNCLEMKGRFVVKLGGLAVQNTQHNCTIDLDKD
jgi:hypothetical protein